MHMQTDPLKLFIKKMKVQSARKLRLIWFFCAHPRVSPRILALTLTLSVVGNIRGGSTGVLAM